MKKDSVGVASPQTATKRKPFAVVVTPEVLARMFEIGNETHVQVVESPIFQQDRLTHTLIDSQGNIKLLFNNALSTAGGKTVTVKTVH